MPSRNSSPDPFATRERLVPLISADEITQKVRELGGRISRDYAGSEVVLVTVLKGAFMFLADLIRAVDIPVSVDFMRVRSYGPRTETSGVVEITADLSAPVQGKRVLFVEDIVDTGLTMAYLIDNIRTRRPDDVRICALLHKPARKLVETHIDYLGFEIPDRFVVGYGLDYDEQYRHLPYIAMIEDGPPL